MLLQQNWNWSHINRSGDACSEGGNLIEHFTYPTMEKKMFGICCNPPNGLHFILKPRRLSFKADHFPIEATTPIFPQDLFERWLEVKQQLYSRNKKKRIGWKVILVTRLRCTEQIQFTTITNATDVVFDLPYDSKHHGIISILSAIQFIFWRIKFISNCQTLPSRGKFSPLNNSASQM